MDIFAIFKKFEKYEYYYFNCVHDYCVFLNEKPVGSFIFIRHTIFLGNTMYKRRIMLACVYSFEAFNGSSCS